jgi:4-hydroxy-2-oxoheptanedioate aldolase
MIMKANGVRKIWNEGGSVVNGWLGIPNSFSAEVMAHATFDSVTVDMQHGMVDFQAAVGMLQALSTTDVTPLARVSWNDPTPIMKTLDAGAYGIVCPMINSQEECERFVGACRYAPDGYRSFGPIRATLYAGADYQVHANATVLTFAMIETAQALENLEAIVSTPGLDGVYIGPADLALSLGHKPKFDHTEPELLEPIERILGAAKAHGVMPGIHCGSAAYAKRMIDLGFQLVTLLSDQRLLVAAAKAMVDDLRGLGTGAAGGAGAGAASETGPY